MTQLFGEKLRVLRQQHGLTQAELAHRLGLAAHSHIAKLENNHDAPSLILALRVAYSFSVALDYLIRDVQPVDQIIAFAIDPSLGLPTASTLFSVKLRTLRQQRDVSQAVLSKHLGLSRQGYISNLETGRKAPSLNLVVHIADFFGVTTDYLLRDEIPV